MRIEWQVEHHFWIVTSRSIVGLTSWMVDEMRKEFLVTCTVIIVGGILDW